MAGRLFVDNGRDAQIKVAIAAHGFRVEHGALVLVLSAGCVTAWAPGRWRAIEAEGAA